MASNMNPWGSTASVSPYSAAIAGASAGSNSCMTPGANIGGTGNFMGVPQSQLAGVQSQCAGMFFSEKK